MTWPTIQVRWNKARTALARALRITSHTCWRPLWAIPDTVSPQDTASFVALLVAVTLACLFVWSFVCCCFFLTAQWNFVPGALVFEVSGYLGSMPV